MTNIAFIARAAGGKTTAAEMLAGMGYGRVGFAEPLRALNDLHGEVSPADWPEVIRLWAYRFKLFDALGRAEVNRLEAGILGAFKRYPVVAGKTRPMLQNIGTEVGRGIHDMLWVNLALTRAEAIDRPAVALDDCRFENEAHALKAAGWVLSYIWAREATLDKRYAALYGAPMSAEQKSHASEAGIPKLRPLCHHVINNDTDSLSDLYNGVEYLDHAATMIRSIHA